MYPESFLPTPKRRVHRRDWIDGYAKRRYGNWLAGKAQFPSESPSDEREPIGVRILDHCFPSISDSLEESPTSNRSSRVEVTESVLLDDSDTTMRSSRNSTPSV